jgi:hypothetical protein
MDDAVQRENFVNYFVDDVFKRSNVSVPYARHVVPSTLREYILPMELTPEEHRAKAGLLEAVRSTQASHSMNISEASLPKDYEPFLILAAPKKPEVHKVVMSAQIALHAPPPARQKRSSEGRRGRGGATKKSLINTASEYYEKEKRSRGGGAADDEDFVPEESEYFVTHQVVDANLYPKLEALFNAFWEYEIDDEKANAVFFGRIDQFNYKDFGFARYIAEFCNLPIIKVGCLRRARYKRFTSRYVHIRSMSTVYV